MNAERVVTLTRDAVSALIGAGGIAWQLWTGHVDPTAMLVCAALLGIPSIFNLPQLRPGGTGTPESSSPSPPASPPPPSPSQSSST